MELFFRVHLGVLDESQERASSRRGGLPYCPISRSSRFNEAAHAETLLEHGDSALNSRRRHPARPAASVRAWLVLE